MIISLQQTTIACTHGPDRVTVNPYLDTHTSTFHTYTISDTHAYTGTHTYTYYYSLLVILNCYMHTETTKTQVVKVRLSGEVALLQKLV